MKGTGTRDNAAALSTYESNLTYLQAQGRVPYAQADGWRKVKVVAVKGDSWRHSVKGIKPKNNPSEFESAVAASEDFHGTDAHELIEVKRDIFEHDTLGDLGELVSMDIKSINGGMVHLSAFKGARLAQSPKGSPYQLYIEGGDQSVDLAEFDINEPHESEVLGHLKRIVYFTDKKHLGREGGIANYKHRLGEVSGKLPHVIYDVLNEALSISGGAYTILPEGIDD